MECGRRGLRTTPSCLSNKPAVEPIALVARRAWRGRLARAARPCKMAVAAGCCLAGSEPAVEPVALAGHLARPARSCCARESRMDRREPKRGKPCGSADNTRGDTGARCVSSARRDLCGGERGNPPPYRDHSRRCRISLDDVALLHTKRSSSVCVTNEREPSFVSFNSPLRTSSPISGIRLCALEGEKHFPSITATSAYG